MYSDSEYESEFDQDVEDVEGRLDSFDAEYSVKNYQPNIHQSAVQLLTQVPNITPANITAWLHTLRLITPIEEVYDDICTYVGNSQDHTHKFGGIQIHQIFRIVRNNEHEFSSNEKRLRMLLWHGTQTMYVPAILQYGFKPPAAKGQMFGAGIYFADRCSKSAQYCHPHLNPKVGDFGYMFLCEVILGKMYNAKNAKNTYTTAPTAQSTKGYTINFDSVKCTGGSIPDISEQVQIGRTIIPLGKTVKNTKYTTFTVMYNEFIVYDAALVKPKYLVKIEFTPGKITY